MIIKEAVEKQKARARDWGFAESTQKKTPYLWIEFVFTELVGDNNEELTIKDYMYLTDKTIEYVVRDLTTMGWHGVSIFDLDKSDPKAFDLSQKEVLLTVEIEQYTNDKGETKNRPKVKFINDPDYVPDTPMEKQELKKLNDKIRAKVMAYRSKNGNGNGTVKKEVKETVTNEENIPF